MRRNRYSCYCEGPYHHRDCPIVSTEWQERRHGRGNMMTYDEDEDKSSYYSHFEHFTSPSYKRAEQRKIELLSSQLNTLINMTIEQNRVMVEQDSKLEAVAKQLDQLIKDVAEIKRNQEKLVGGTVSVADEEDGVADLQELESEGVIHVVDTTPIEYDLLKDAQVYPNLSPISMPTNKCGDKGSRIRIKKVRLKGTGQSIKKRPHNNYSTGMSIVVKRFWTRHVSHRAYIGNSVGKCSIQPP